MNVHEKPEFLRQQISAFEKYFKFSWRLALSCNSVMHAQLAGEPAVNPEVIEKRRFHGSLLRGIMSNIRWQSSQDLLFVLVMSSRTVPRRAMELDDLHSWCAWYQSKITSEILGHTLSHLRDFGQPGEYNHAFDDWDWVDVQGTRFFSDRLQKGMVAGPHEGFLFRAEKVPMLLEVMDEYTGLFETEAQVEEIFLQTMTYQLGVPFAHLSPCVDQFQHPDFPCAKVVRR